MASQITGVKLQNASTEGLRVLRLLNALTPPEQSEDIFLPQQRAIFLMQHLNGWLLSEDEAAEDITEEIEARIALLYSALAPIVQDVSGSHWNSIYDMISSNLEVSSAQTAPRYPNADKNGTRWSPLRMRIRLISCIRRCRYWKRCRSLR